MRIVSPSNVFKPHGLEILEYFLINILILVGFNVSAIISHVKKTSQIDPKEFVGSISSQFSTIGANKVVKLTTIVIFWSIIGLVVYTIFWLTMNFFTGVKNEVVLETGYVNKASFIQRIRLPLVRFVLGVLLLGIIGASIRITYPLWIGLVRQFIVSFETLDAQTIGLMVLGFIGACVNLYIIVTFTRLIFAIED